MKSISTFVIAFLIVGFFFLALPEKGNAQRPLPPFCCQVTLNSCVDEIEVGVPITCNDSDIVLDTFCNDSTGQCVQPAINTPIPTISEWGLIAMASILGIVGFMVIRRRKLTA